ncbi:MAG: response regulator transcription factor [Lachnospiraceae bacterium]|nr:response regulator transcription factor [Lachnospiraceae bacterium]MBO5144754.1 response regulator transcription factor [Lachnospiraceae bacterium]
MNRILIVEPEFELAEKLCRSFSDAETQALSCGTMEAADALLKREKYQMVIVDTKLPDGDGHDLISDLGLGVYLSENPVIIAIVPNNRRPELTDLNEQGITDFITKPFSTAVLKAKVCTHFRRRKKDSSFHASERFEATGSGTPSSISGEHRVATDAYVFDFDAEEYSLAGNTVKLNSLEQCLLRTLVENKGIVLKRKALTEKLSSESRIMVNEFMLSQLVRSLVDKLIAHNYIKTIYGIGYIWEDSEENPQNGRG